MPWFKVDDGFHGHPKVMDLSLAAVGLWTLAGTWCANYLTDGEIHLKAIQRLGGTKKQAKELVSSGLWAEKRPEIYQFCDWNDYQPTKEVVQAERAQARERMKDLRSKRKGTAKAETPESSGQAEDVRPNNSRTEEERSAEPAPHDDGTDPERSEEVRVAPTQPLPLSPIPIPTKEEKTSSPATPDEDEEDPKMVYPPPFEAFWDAYPRKVGKKAALAAFKQARKIASLQTICEGAARYRDDPNLPAVKFRPHPATWLNEGRWDDEPQPEQNVVAFPQKQTHGERVDAAAAALIAKINHYDQIENPQFQLGEESWI